MPSWSDAPHPSLTGGDNTTLRAPRLHLNLSYHYILICQFAGNVYRKGGSDGVHCEGFWLYTVLATRRSVSALACESSSGVVRRPMEGTDFTRGVGECPQPNL